MFESTEKETFETMITGVQYLTLAALLKAASQDKSRFAITRVFYDHTLDQFVATDGHALRVEKLEWMEGEKPQNSFFLSKRDLMLSQAQIMLKHGIEQNAEAIEEVLVPIEYMAYEDYPEHPYPNYAAVLPKKKQRRPVEYVGMSLDLLANLRRTFYELPRAVRFLFHGPLNGVGLYDAESDRFLGLLMPCRAESGAPELMFELKEIQREAPKENAEPTAEDLGQQNLVTQSANGPVD